MLANLVQAAATETQVILSTQSALLLDHFQPEDVLVADLEQGATTLKRLQSQDLAGWLEEYSLGQLWEKNQFGGRPTLCQEGSLGGISSQRRNSSRAWRR